MDDIEMWVEEDGTLTFIHDDDLAEALAEYATSVDTRRASHVEPCEGGWTADMAPVGGPVLTDGGRPFRTRRAALAAEVAWLRVRMAEGPVEVERCRDVQASDMEERTRRS